MDILEFLLCAKGIVAVFSEDVHNYTLGKLTRLYEDICMYFDDNPSFKQPTLLFGQSLDGDTGSLFVEYKGEEFIILELSSSDDVLGRIRPFIEMEWRNISLIYGTDNYKKDDTSDPRNQMARKTIDLFEEFFLFYSASHEIGHYLVNKGILDSYSVPPTVNCAFAPVSSATRHIIFGSSTRDRYFSSMSFHEEITCDCFSIFVLFNYYLFREGEKGPLMPTISQMLSLLLLYKKNLVLLEAALDGDNDDVETYERICGELEIRQIISYCVSEQLVQMYCQAFCSFNDYEEDSDEVKELLESSVLSFGTTYSYLFKLLSHHLHLYRLRILRYHLDEYDEVFKSSNIAEFNRLHKSTPFAHTIIDPKRINETGYVESAMRSTFKRYNFIKLMEEEYGESDIEVFHLPLKPIVKNRIPFHFD